MAKRKPVPVSEILIEEIMKPMGLIQAVLADAMGVQRKHVNELYNDHRKVTAATALNLARVFGIREVDNQIWLVSFLDYDLGFFDANEGRVEPAPNPFTPEKL